MELFIVEEVGGYGLALACGGEARVRIDRPVSVIALGLGGTARPYDRIEEDGSRWRASVRIEAADGSIVDVVDAWQIVDERTIRIDRQVSEIHAGSSGGLRFELGIETDLGGVVDPDEFEYCIPGALYGRNDTDHDGVEDYLGTYVQSYRDDRLPSLAVLARLPRLRTYVALARADVPEFDPAIGDEEVEQRSFAIRTDIGSLGLRPLPGRPQVELRASYPFAEEASFCLNTAGDGWAAYLPHRAGLLAEVSYVVRMAAAETLADAIWDVTTDQIARLGTVPSELPFSLEQALDWRMRLTQSRFRRWAGAEDPREPAGYLVHFSPRSGDNLATLLEYGFSGAQTLLAYTSLRYGYLRDDPDCVGRARSVIDFFVRHCQRDNGFTHGIYDVAKRSFVYWFTGILMPFQYAVEEADVRHYLGGQMTRALWSIASELRAIRGNYLRTMCESVLPILLAWKSEAERGAAHPDWLAAAERFGGFLLRTQGEDGSWFRAYDVDGNGLERPAAWFGSGRTEQKSGTIFPIPVLLELHRATGDARYLEAARRAGEFIVRTFVDPVEYVGGLNDTTHIKSVKTDSVGVMFVMRSLVRLYEVTGDSACLQGAVQAARILASWVFLWDVPFPPDSLLARTCFRTTGWAVCDVIAAGSYVDNEFLEFTGDLARVAVHSGEEGLLGIAEIVQLGMQEGLSTPERTLGYVTAGIQCEGVLTSYWLRDPDRTAFSGAANKPKGEDNDTCNGLTNGQMAYGLFDLLDTFGTSDFRRISAQDARRRIADLPTAGGTGIGASAMKLVNSHSLAPGRLQRMVHPAVGGSLEQREARLGWTFVTPALVVVALVALWPLINTFMTSLTNARLASGREPSFVGLRNYADLLQDTQFINSIWVTVWFSVITLTCEFVLGMAVALIVNSRFRGRGAIRAAILVPWAIPTVISAQMWNWMYNDIYGVINDILVDKLHVLERNVAWTAEPALALPAIAAVDVWKTTPFVALLLLAGLQLIPDDVVEAARVDGAGRVRQFLSITLPLLRPTILVALIFRTLDTLRVFDVFYVVFGTRSDTQTMAIYNQQQIVAFSQLGYGSTVSVAMFVIIGVFVVAYVRLFGVRDVS